MAAPSGLSRELALLASCGLDSDAVLAERAREAGSAEIDWARFGDLALGHGIAGMAGERLGRAAPDILPAPLAEAMRRSLQLDAMRLVAQTAETARLSSLLDQSGIAVLVIKGVGLAHLLYPEQPAWRSSCDIDLLVRPEDLPEADRLLRAAGYARTAPAADPPRGAGRAMFLHLDNVFDYVHPETEQLVELHHRIALNPHWVPCSFAELRQAASPVETEWGTIRALEGPANLAYLCWHALGHYRFLLKWICDIARAIERAGATSGGAFVAQERPEISARPAALVDALIAVVSSAGARQSDLRWQAEAARIAARMEDPAEFPTRRSFARLPAEIANELFLMRLSDRWPGKAYQMLRLLADPRDAYALGLGPGWAPVYAALGPFLSAGRFLRRPASAA